MRILVWHVHGGWLEAFVKGRHEYLIPADSDGGRRGLERDARDWPATVQEIDLAAIDPDSVDAVVLQRPGEIAAVAWALLRQPGVDLPAVYVEHNAPRVGAPFTQHPMADQHRIPVVHVTHFNQLIWDTGSANTTVIEHGIPDPGRLYTGEREEMGVVVNEPVRRGRVAGTDLLPGFARVGPLRVFGTATEALPEALNLMGHGLGEEQLLIAGDIPAPQLHRQLSRCRLYLHLFRWTSLGRGLLEAMHLGMPVVALGTAETHRAVPRGAGLVSNDMDELHVFVRRLLDDPDDAYAMGLVAREAALERYGLGKFLNAWDELLAELGAGRRQHRQPSGDATLKISMASDHEANPSSAKESPPKGIA